jgi:hypothetical protein
MSKVWHRFISSHSRAYKLPLQTLRQRIIIPLKWFNGTQNIALITGEFIFVEIG